MLRALDISDMLIIDRLELSFDCGLNVLTGETGAGKSILLDALGFVLGWRGRADLVRSGADYGEVTACFDLPNEHPARTVLREAGLPESDELILRRRNSADGRKTAWINDRRAGGEVLRGLSNVLVELHGQHDDRGLINPRAHRGILDSYARAELARQAVFSAWHTWQEARAALSQAQARMAEIRSEEDYLRHAVCELEALTPKTGEEEALDTRRRQMQAAIKIRADVVKAYEALGYDGAEGAAANALRWLEGVAGKAEGALERPMAALGRMLVELDDARQGVADAIEAMSFNPLELEETEERLFALRALARKHDVSADELEALAAHFQQKLDQLDAGSTDLTRLSTQLETAKARYFEAAGSLSQIRHEACGRLDAAVNGQLAPLKMERAVFSTHLTPQEPGPEGQDGVAFCVATNPGTPAGPLGKIASGGELSRFLLALKVCLAQGYSGMTMIFDEIDRGVGGATADAVGRRLRTLAEDGQVLVVTHSPQVAALGQTHMRVSKHVNDRGMTCSMVTRLSHSDRIDEIARMLSGDRITDAARSAARVLLDA